jgi:hypothetical protein
VSRRLRSLGLCFGGSARTPIANLGKEVVYADGSITIRVTFTCSTELAKQFEDVVYIDLAITVAVTVAGCGWEAVDVDRASSSASVGRPDSNEVLGATCARDDV